MSASGLLLLPTLASAYMAPCLAPGAAVAASRACVPTMDETILEKALSGELEQEGAENVFMSEVGWAYYLDKECQSSYNLNERFSKAGDGYVTPSLVSNPLDVAVSWFESMKRVASDPLSASFPTISNDKSGNRAYPKGSSEVQARTIKPKVKDFDKKLRTVGIPGKNIFGTPSSKSPGKFFDIFN